MLYTIVSSKGVLDELRVGKNHRLENSVFNRSLIEIKEIRCALHNICECATALRMEGLEGSSVKREVAQNVTKFVAIDTK
jgi:hypothetical protein